jgi:hypothetical protein
MKIPLAALLAALALAAPGCLSDSPDDYGLRAGDMPSPEGWVAGEPFLCHDFDVLWETAKIQAVRGGYRIDDDATTQSLRRVVTAWKTDLSIRRSDGRRTRRFIELRPEEGQKNAWRARVATVVQRNVDLDDPLNPANAEWRSADPDADDAERVLWLLEARFREFGPSKELDYR